MLLRQMRYLVTVVDAGGFTKAADELYISESAVSQQVRALQRELGVELLRKSGRGFEVTPAGEYFVGHARHLLAEADALRTETVRLGSDDELTLSVGYLSSLTDTCLERAVARFSTTYPEVSLTLFAGTHEENFEAMRNDRADMVVNDQRRVFSDEYENYAVAELPSWVLVPERGDLAKRDFVGTTDLLALPCIVVSPEWQHDVERAFYCDTLGFGENVLFAETLREAELLVLAGRGFLPVWQGEGNTPPAGLARVPLLWRGRPMIRNLCAFWKRLQGGYYVEEFAAMLREEAMASHRETTALHEATTSCEVSADEDNEPIE